MTPSHAFGGQAKAVLQRGDGLFSAAETRERSGKVAFRLELTPNKGAF